MAATHPLLAALQRYLKREGLTYSHVAERLAVSEATVKRLFSTERLTLDRLDALCAVVGIDLTELALEAREGQARLTQLTVEQESEVVRDEELLLVSVLVLNHWRFDDILAAYAIEENTLVRKLAALDRLGVIELLPGNRVRLKVGRDFAWLPGGPIETWFERHALGSFLNAGFHGERERRRFSHGMLSPASRLRLLERIDRLCQEFAELHAEDASLPLGDREGACLLVATRRWEPPVFDAKRRPGARRQPLTPPSATSPSTPGSPPPDTQSPPACR